MKKIISCALICSLVSFMSCVPEETPPIPVELTVSTDTPTNVTATDVTLGGNIVTEGESAIISKGICVGLTANPTIEDPDDFADELGSGPGAFTATYSPFVPSTTYHVRAFAINSKGTVYGEDKTFTTLESVIDPTGCPIVNVTSDISTPTTWTNGNVYVIQQYISVTSTLTIQAGTVIKLDAGRLRVDGSGKILATGNADNRIVFTSLFDDSYCGDTNGDGNTTAPNKGDWYSIYLNGGTGNTFKYCDFLYAGLNDSGYNNCVYISVAGPSFEFDHCTFANTLSSSNSNAFAFHGGYYMIDATVSKFTNNAFYNNDRPIFVDTYYNFSTTNIFHNPADASEKNARNGIWLQNDTNQGATITFGVTEVPYVFTAFFNGGGSGATDVVNINANVILKFADTSAGISRSASRSVTLNASAILTSMKDDTHGGDTNGDGSASSPATGDWDGYYNYVGTTYLTGSNILFAKVH